jgi:hypothetical protein
VIKVTPFELVYGQETMLPMDLNLQFSMVVHQDKLTGEEYNIKLMDEIDVVHESHFVAIREIEKEKLRVAKAYNKKVCEKSIQIGDMVWKTILPLGTRSTRFGKWSSSWEGPYKVVKIVPENAYFVETLKGKSLPKALNGK